MDNEEGKLSDRYSGSLVAHRHQMVERQLRARGIDHTEILRAFAEISRERFLPPDRSGQAYGDYPVPIGHGQTISQPYVVALMLQELDPLPSHRVLDVGAGSGYQTGLLARLVKWVYAIERIPELAERAARTLTELNFTNISVRTGDGTLGWSEEAPFDRIICGAAAPHVPSSWLDQLTDGGRIVLPIGGPETQRLVVVEKIHRETSTHEICGVRFVKLIGAEGWSDES